MSDQSNGHGWWQASDGKWYPPEQHPNYRPQPTPSLPATPPPLAAPLPGATPPTAQPPFIPAVPQQKKKGGCLKWVLIAFAILVGIIVIGAIVGTSDDDNSATTDQNDDPADGSDEASPDNSSNAAGSADEIDDVGPCTLVDSETVLLDVTNNSGKQSSYLIDVNFLDAAGQRVGDEPFFLNYLRPGERALEESFAFDTAGGTSCEIAEVERFSAESPDDINEVACEVTGEDFIGDIATRLVATNGSSKLSDYLITATLVRDGVRIGDVSALVENIRPGESAPTDGFSVVDGPAAGVNCEVVYVERLASE
jgi:hypothetical protein